MEMAQPASTNTHLFSSPPAGYQALGATRLVEKDTSKVCLRAGSASVEVTALAPDLFRVGIFPDGRAVSYYSEAVVAQGWEAGYANITESDAELSLATEVATAHVS